MSGKIYIVHCKLHTCIIRCLSGSYAYDTSHTHMHRGKNQCKFRITYHTCMFLGDHCICVSPNHTCMAQFFKFNVTFEIPYMRMRTSIRVWEDTSQNWTFLHPHTHMGWIIHVWAEGKKSFFFFSFSFCFALPLNFFSFLLDSMTHDSCKIKYIT